MPDEWWTYRPSDFVMFSPRLYARLFEAVNQAAWPLALAFAIGGLWWLIRNVDRTSVQRALPAALALAWATSGWLFHAERFAPINWPAAGFALAFGVQAALLALAAVAGGWRLRATGPRRRAGAALLAWALVGHPLLAAAFGQPWRQAECFGLAPDATALGTLGVLLMLRTPGWSARALWLLPWAWVAISAATLATMDLPQAWVLLGLGALAALAASRD